MEPLIRVENLTKDYETAPAVVLSALKGIDLSIGEGEFVAVMGPSGSGKSTFMNVLGCLDGPTRGRYFLGGEDTARLAPDALAALRNRLIGFVFQGFNLLARLDAEDNVALPLLYADTGAAERGARAREQLARVGLAGHAHHRPNQLSGGQQQRVAIARALVNHPRLLLADEPTGNLDTATSGEIMQLLARLNREEGITIVLVTHENDIARWARRLVRFRDGLVVEDVATAAVFPEAAP